ncbi:MAG: glycoside hydrolase family 127 protein [Sedimentisphaerales bacterium]|nr:glycoside hydrolase family 127 protein [Sedimentisphaerales bacterium]
MNAIRIVVLLLSASCFVWGDTVQIVDKPDVSRPNQNYVGNRQPLAPSPLIKLPPQAIQPGGWLYKQVRLQADGFHGHLTEISDFLKKDKNAWLSKDGSGSRGWEEVPYWLKGFSAAAFTLGDTRLLDEAKIWIEGALNSQQADGWFGPDKGRTGLATDLKGREDLWPNMIMLFILQDYYEYCGDERVIPLMLKYCRYLASVPEDKFLVGYWPSMRGGDQLYSIYWLYNHTVQPWLLDLAHKVHRKTARWDEDVINWHNVNMAQGFREPTIYWMQTGQQKHAVGAERNWQKMRAMYGQVPGGMYGADENARKGYTDPRQAVETCGMVEMTLSCEILLRATGAAVWADRCEDVMFNSLPAAMTADFKALRYLTSPNMAVSDSKDKKPGIQNGGPMFHMNPHSHRCCQHNAGHGWPYYVQNLWQATAGDGLAAVMYAPCTVTAKAGKGVSVTIREQTKYPFEETVEFIVEPEVPVTFPLYLRIPGWCKAPTAAINGKAQAIEGRGQAFVQIEREWKAGDKVSLTLPMETSLRIWKDNKNSVSVDRGPLTYSLQIQEHYKRNGGTDIWPAWDILPQSAWNYGLVLTTDNPARGFEVVKGTWPADDQPFKWDAAPITLKAKARKIPAWTLDEKGLLNVLPPSPVMTDQPEETVTLIPMGAARLRISSFPTIASEK